MFNTIIILALALVPEIAPEKNGNNPVTPPFSKPITIGSGEGWEVVVGPYQTREECHHELNKQLEKAVNTYVDGYLNRPGHAGLVRFNAEFIQSEYLQSPIQEQIIESSVGQMRQLTAVMKFEQSLTEEIDRRWRAAQVTSRLLQAALISGGVLLMLTTLFAYLKLDDTTLGAYTVHLKCAAATVIVSLALAGMFIARFISWI